MKERPLSITIISWILIIMGGVSSVTSYFSLQNPIAQKLMEENPIPINIQIVLMYFGLSVIVVCGVAMLKQINWGRYLYTGWSIIGFTIGLFTTPMKFAMIPGFLVMLVIVYFLFRSEANEYFKVKENA